jgi:hypothetical protein
MPSISRWKRFTTKTVKTRREDRWAVASVPPYFCSKWPNPDRPFSDDENPGNHEQVLAQDLKADHMKIRLIDEHLNTRKEMQIN